MSDSDHHEEDVPTQPSAHGFQSSEILRKAFDRAAGPSDSEAAIPERIGPFRVLGRVGRGGMGSVYKCVDERDGSAGRVVAIKLIRKGLDTEDVMARFKLEGQLLSALNHPNIARLHEVAETEDGQPYFVMEFIEGKPIDAYCDTQRVSIAKRLEIFRKVCSAVHHAHTNLIVHRDLKPGNIIVTPEGEPKLLDFGIAKLLNPALGRVEVLTRPTMRIMTPEYASPEQVRGEVVGTRSDVYSLGVLLYELLCGRRPYHFAKRIEAEVVRVICESVPMRPSTAITSVTSTREDEGKPPSASTITPASIAESRSAERVESLRRSLTGDLDDIVMMAMSKEADRRYASAEHFSLDLARYLDGRPVEARRTGARRLYLMRKFLRRHRTEVAAAMIVLLALIAGGSVAAYQWRRAAIAGEEAAVAARQEAAALEEKLDAEKNLAVASAFGDALWSTASSDLTFTMSPSERGAFWAGVRDSFEEISERYPEDNPQVRLARSRALLQAGHAMGGVRSGNRGEFEEALEAYTASRDGLVELYENEPDNRSYWSEAIEAQLRVADSLRRTNQPTSAMKEYERAIEIADAGDFQDDLSAQRQRSKPRFSLGQTAVHMGDADLASRLFSEEIEARRGRVDAHADNANVRRDLAVALVNSGELALEMNQPGRGRDMLREALDIRRSLAEEFSATRFRPTLERDVAVSLIAVGLLEAHEGVADAARPRMEEAFAILDALAQESPDDARVVFTSASAAVEYALASVEGDLFDEAAYAAERAATDIERLEQIAPFHASLVTLRARLRLATAHLALHDGDPDAALRDYETARDQFRALLTADAGNIIMTRFLGDALVGLAQARESSGAAPASVRAALNEAREVYSRCGEPGQAFGPSSERWRRVSDQPAGN